jgi:hypothetical protein
MRLRRPVREHVVSRVPRAGVTAQRFTEEVGRYPKVVAVDQPPPVGMSLRLEILAALFHDSETIYTMRNC